MNWWLWCRNKNDVKDEEKVVSYEDGAAFAKENDLMFMEASAKTGYNVDNIFISTAREIIHRIKQGKMTLGEKDGVKIAEAETTNNVTIGKKASIDKKKCC